MMRWLIAFLLACLTCQGQDGACSVEGIVLNAATGEPLKGVELTLVGGDTGEQAAPVSTTSDERGAYHFSGVAPGRYLLVARRIGFTSSYGPDGALTSSSTFLLTPGDKARNIVVRLAPYANIRGRISDDTGKPAAGAFVMAYRVGDSRTGKRLFQAGRDIAGAEGKYRVAGLPPGRYYISAVERGGLGSRGGTGVTYYPGTVHFETAVALDLTGAADLPNIDLRLAKAGTVCVQVRPEAQRDGLRVSFTARHSIAPEWNYSASPTGVD
jgi:protocatechuate 3,4-dioxygenase beta subunit